VHRLFLFGLFAGVRRDQDPVVSYGIGRASPISPPETEASARIGHARGYPSRLEDFADKALFSTHKIRKSLLFSREATAIQK